jgi:uncharacterized protein YaaW (UPF0174 family)
MKYQKDKDLEFLKNVKSQDLENLVQILTSTKTEELSKRDIYKEFYPNHSIYWEEIAAELQYFGGNTVVNIIRSKGVLYSEIVRDVSKTFGIKSNENESIEKLEENILNIDREKGILNSIKQQALGLDLKDGLFLIGTRLNPFINVAFVFKKLSDPAYRITTEAVIEIAKLRKKYKNLSAVIVANQPKEKKDLKLNYSNSLVLEDKEENTKIAEIKVLDIASSDLVSFQQKNDEENLQNIKHLISDITKGIIGTSNQTVELVFSPEVQKGLANGTYKLLDNRAIVVNSTGGRIKEHATILKSGQGKQLLTGGYQLLSVAVAQSHLADIEKRLKNIENTLNDIKTHLENDDISKLLGSIKYIISEVKNESDLTDIRKNKIEDIKYKAFQWREKLSLEISDCLKKIKNIQHKDTFGTENMYKEIASIIKDDMSRLKYKYELLMELHILLTMLDNFINPSENGFKIIELDLEDISRKIQDFYPSLEDKYGLLKSMFNQNDTLEERKKTLNILQNNYKSDFDNLILDYKEKYNFVCNKFQKINSGEVSIILSLDENSEIQKYLIN